MLYLLERQNAAMRDLPLCQPPLEKSKQGRLMSPIISYVSSGVDPEAVAQMFDGWLKGF